MPTIGSAVSAAVDRHRERQARHRLSSAPARRPVPTSARFDASRRRRVVGRTLLGASALVALLAAVGALSALPGADTETVLLDAWRALGLAVFGGLFALVARDPSGYPGVLELAIAHKLGLVSTALIWREAPDAILVLAADGGLTVVLVFAYVLLGGHEAWRRAKGPTAVSGRTAQGQMSRAETSPLPSTHRRNSASAEAVDRRHHVRDEIEENS